MDRFALALYPLLDAATGAEVGLSPAQWRELGAAVRQAHALPPTPELGALAGREAFRPSRRDCFPRWRPRSPGAEAVLAPREGDLMFVVGGIGHGLVRPHDTERFLQGYGETGIDPPWMASWTCSSQGTSSTWPTDLPGDSVLVRLRRACPACPLSPTTAHIALEVRMRRLRLSLGLAALLLLWATPGRGAETLEMNCPVCDHVDVAGHGLEPNATLTLVIRDVRTSQAVLPETQVTTDGSGSFEREFDLDLARHPSLLADLYERNGTTLVLAAHTGAQAPAHCRRAASLPYTGAGTTSAGMVAGGLLAAGGLLLLATRHRRHGPSSPRS